LIQVGQVLDKYELLERVGQGGMAVVYRGLDRSLKRTVAVKILHKHLSDYQEARDRFEREAQAVAKLRHENILEIFDYAAKADDCYIVTEFIDGQTLKQFTTDRPIAYPEIGGMIILQVCRALAHAHAGGILHRDVKPENIMIRSDGVVKLMDFGISHMVDLERLTVTGQLLGSPAYMAPEHVEGRPLDFRTDVFAAGIVLYQLCVGKLPFEGKNPHEVLKRIAECKFVDPRQANPRIGNRLGRIILKAMAAQPKDRYAGVSEMVLALESYLDESGLPKDKIPAELARYFKAPASYEAALKERLIDHLARRGRELLDGDDRSGALDVFDRVLTIDPTNAKVLAILDGINRRARWKQIGIIAGAAFVIGGSAFVMYEKAKVTPEPTNVHIDVTAPIETHVQVSHEDPAPVPIDQTPDAGPADAVSVAVAKIDGGHVVEEIDAMPAVVNPVTITVHVSPAPGSSYRLGKGEWTAVPAETFDVQIVDATEIEVKNACCQGASQHIERDGGAIKLQMQLGAGSIKPTCSVAGVEVTIDGKSRRLDDAFPILFDVNAMSSTKQVHVVFSDGKTIDDRIATVHAGQNLEWPCELH
jgi:serine/threonine-protein kinase